MKVQYRAITLEKGIVYLDDEMIGIVQHTHNIPKWGVLIDKKVHPIGTKRDAIKALVFSKRLKQQTNT